MVEAYSCAVSAYMSYMFMNDQFRRCWSSMCHENYYCDWIVMGGVRRSLWGGGRQKEQRVPFSKEMESGRERWVQQWESIFSGDYT